jgi:hypothetical protein
MAQRLSYPSAKFRWDLPDLWPVDSCPARRNFRPSLADRIIVTCIGSRYNLARLQSRPGSSGLGVLMAKLHSRDAVISAYTLGRSDASVAFFDCALELMKGNDATRFNWR